MRWTVQLTSACLLAAAPALSAQESLPPPAVDASGPAIAPALSPPRPAPGFAPPPGYTPSPAYSIYSPPATYPSAGPVVEPVSFRDPAGNPFLWLGIEGLIWWTRGQAVSVPLVTTGPASQGNNAGNLGVPGTVSLNQPLNYGAAGGTRFFAGGWFDSDHTIGMDGSIFLLGSQSAGYHIIDRAGDGSLVINTPVVGAPFTTQISAPGMATGNVHVNVSAHFGGGDVDLLYNLYRDRGWTLNLLGGYRYVQLNESITIDSRSDLFTTATYTDALGNVIVSAPPGSTIVASDRFSTRNQFNGGQLGVNFQRRWGRLSVSGAAKLAIGDMHEVVTVSGATNVMPINAAPVPLSGGNFATLQQGRYGQDRFAFIPEVQCNLGYQITPWMRGQIGYNFLYLSRVVRPGNQIDNFYDGVNHPAVPMTNSSFWAQGLNIGLLFSF
jgi:hypothetical protein